MEAVIDEIHSFNQDRSEGERIKVSVELEKHFVMDSAHNIYRTADLVSDSTICLSLYLLWYLSYSSHFVAAFLKQLADVCPQTVQ